MVQLFPCFYNSLCNVIILSPYLPLIPTKKERKSKEKEKKERRFTQKQIRELEKISNKLYRSKLHNEKQQNNQTEIKTGALE